MEVKRAICHFCKGRCRVLVRTENGHLIDIEEDKSAPTAGSTYPPLKGCIRLRAAKEWMYHPNRLNFPLKRVGGKGEGKWQAISWNQALDEVAYKLKHIKDSYGAEAIVHTRGTGRTTGFEHVRFFNLLGSPNYIGQGNICAGPDRSVSRAMFGWTIRYQSQRGISAEDVTTPATKCQLLLGIDYSQSHPRNWKFVRDSKKLGQKMIVIDPRRTPTVELADIWLQPRPGTDVALLMSMINVIIEEGLYDKEFVVKWCYGFDALAKRAREYLPDKVAEIAWVPADKIREAARMYATNKPAVASVGMGLEQQQQVIEGLQARYILTALTGNIDIEGGEYLPGPSGEVSDAEITCEDALPPEQKKKQLGRDRFKLISWTFRDLVNPYSKKVWGVECGTADLDAAAHDPTVYRAILTGKPYPVKAVITSASNPMLTSANTKLVYEALKSLELYVVADFFLTPSAQLADYVFPITSWLERPWYWPSTTDCNIRCGEQALPSTIPGEYDRRTDYELFRELGIRLGQSWPWENLLQVCDYRLKPLGLTFKEIMARGGEYSPAPQYKKYERIGFATPTGKCELYSTIFEKLGYDPLPHYEETFENPVSTPELAKEYPLMLINGGRTKPQFHSEFLQVDSLRRRHPHPLIQINPETARGLGIEDGDWVWVESPRGVIRMRCRLFEGIDLRVVHAEHAWWFPEFPPKEPQLSGVWESNINILINDDPDVCNKLSGGWPLRTALCKIYKCSVY